MNPSNPEVRQAIMDALDAMQVRGELPIQKDALAEILKRLKGLGEPADGRTYEFCAEAQKDGWGEFKGYDLFWLECAGSWHNLLKAKLVLEYQRNTDNDWIRSDFHGLLLVRAEFRVLIFQVEGGPKEAASKIDALKKQATEFDQHSGEARGEYMLACYCKSTGDWHCDPA